MRVGSRAALAPCAPALPRPYCCCRCCPCCCCMLLLTPAAAVGLPAAVLEEGLHHEVERGGALESAWGATKATLDALVLDGDFDVHAVRQEVFRIKTTLEELGKLAGRGEILTVQQAGELMDAKLSGPGMDTLLQRKIRESTVRDRGVQGWACTLCQCGPSTGAQGQGEPGARVPGAGVVGAEPSHAACSTSEYHPLSLHAPRPPRAGVQAGDMAHRHPSAVHLTRAPPCALPVCRCSSRSWRTWCSATRWTA